MNPVSSEIAAGAIFSFRNSLVTDNAYFSLYCDDGEEPAMDLKYRAQFISIVDWTIAELLDAISDRPFEDPRDIVHNYREKMECYAEEAPTEEQNFIYTVSSDVARQISLLI